MKFGDPLRKSIKGTVKKVKFHSDENNMEREYPDNTCKNFWVEYGYETELFNFRKDPLSMLDEITEEEIDKECKFCGKAKKYSRYPFINKRIIKPNSVGESCNIMFGAKEQTQPKKIKLLCCKIHGPVYYY